MHLLLLRYLQERFNVSLDASCKELSAVAGAVALAGRSSSVSKPVAQLAAQLKTVFW